MKVHWYVTDNYVGGDRPQVTEIDDDELAEYTGEERDQYICDCVQEDFDNKISYCITRKEK